MMEKFLKEIENELCNKCVYKDTCHILCPNAMRKILGLKEEQSFYGGYEHEQRNN